AQNSIQDKYDKKTIFSMFANPNPYGAITLDTHQKNNILHRVEKGKVIVLVFYYYPLLGSFSAFSSVYQNRSSAKSMKMQQNQSTLYSASPELSLTGVDILGKTLVKVFNPTYGNSVSGATTKNPILSISMSQKKDSAGYTGRPFQPQPPVSLKKKARPEEELNVVDQNSKLADKKGFPFVTNSTPFGLVSGKNVLASGLAPKDNNSKTVVELQLIRL
ncbi:MAG: hypothetical protein M1812_008562, partial [Candelaria pacifica]